MKNGTLGLGIGLQALPWRPMAYNAAPYSAICMMTAQLQWPRQRRTKRIGVSMFCAAATAATNQFLSGLAGRVGGGGGVLDQRGWLAKSALAAC